MDRRRDGKKYRHGVVSFDITREWRREVMLTMTGDKLTKVNL